MPETYYTREEIIAFCMTFPDAVEDYPFDDFNWTIMRHAGNNKMFAAIYKHTGDRIWINLKAEPMWGEIWCGTYESVVPAFHMNKKHWVSVILDGKMHKDDIERLITDSWHLTKPRTQ